MRLLPPAEDKYQPVASGVVVSRLQEIESPKRSVVSMTKLRHVLRRPINDNARTRRYQERIDDAIGAGIQSVNESAGWPPHYYAFSWLSPISRWHGNEQILEMCQRGLADWSKRSLNDELSDIRNWDHTWSFEGIAYAYIWTEDALTQETRELFLKACAHNASIFTQRTNMGTVGNQCMSGILGDLLYGCLLDDEALIQLSRQRFDEFGPKVIMESGQVNEQYGPCPNYSSGAFVFTFMYVLLAEIEEWRPRIIQALRWFRWMHTESLYVFPGPSSRKYYSRWMIHLPLHTFAGLEYASATQPMFLDFRDRYEALAGDRSHQHICSTDTISILLNTGEGSGTNLQQASEWNQPLTEFYEQTWFLRSPIKYALVRRKYQTAICFTGWLPMMGLQTWAWGQEPPIIHPLHGAVSSTLAWGIDTAANSSDHYYYGHGAGVMAPAVIWRPHGSSRESLPDEPPFVLWRHKQLIQLAIFTEVSTVIIHTGETGRRVTRWALNPIEPATPVIETGVVRFEDRIGRIYSLKGRPNIEEGVGEYREENEERNLELLTWETEDNESAFAFSNDSFEFLRDDLSSGRTLDFKDETGTYRADISNILDEDGYLHRDELTAQIKRIHVDGEA